MDSSGSELRAFYNMIDISKQMVALLNLGPINAHVAQIRFASSMRSRIDYDFNKFYNKIPLIDFIEKTRVINGTTNVDRSLELALDMFNDPKFGARPSNIIRCKDVVKPPLSEHFRGRFIMFIGAGKGRGGGVQKI